MKIGISLAGNEISLAGHAVSFAGNDIPHARMVGRTYCHSSRLREIVSRKRERPRKGVVILPACGK